MWIMRDRGKQDRFWVVGLQSEVRPPKRALYISSEEVGRQGVGVVIRAAIISLVRGPGFPCGIVHVLVDTVL